MGGCSLPRRDCKNRNAEHFVILALVFNLLLVQQPYLCAHKHVG